jgi:hypothetical protein
MVGYFLHGLIIDQFCGIAVLADPVLHLVYGTFVDRPYPHKGCYKTRKKRSYQESDNKAALQV